MPKDIKAPVPPSKPAETFHVDTVRSVAMAMVRRTEHSQPEPMVALLRSAEIHDAVMFVPINGGDTPSEVWDYELTPASGCFNVPDGCLKRIEFKPGNAELAEIARRELGLEK